MMFIEYQLFMTSYHKKSAKRYFVGHGKTYNLVVL